MQVKGQRIFMIVLVMVQCAFIITFVLCVEYDQNAKPNLSTQDVRSSDTPTGNGGTDGGLKAYPSKWTMYMLLRYNSN